MTAATVPLAVETGRAKRSGRFAPMTIVRLAVTAGAFVLIARKIGLGAVVRALADANPAYLAAGYAIAVVTILLTVWQWNGLATANGVARPYRRCLHLELGGDVFDAALPSSIGGDFIRATSLAKSQEERVPAAASVVLRRLCNFPGMIVITAVGLVATMSLGYADRIRPFSLGVVAGGMLLVVLALSPAMGVIGRWGLLRRGPGRAVAKLLNTLHEFRGQRSHLARATLRGLLFWAVVVASQSMFIRALGIHIPLTYGALVITTATAVTMLPISLGGYGLREGAFAAFLAAGGHATAAQGAAVGVCITVQTLALGVIGIPFYLTIRLRRGRHVAPRRRRHVAPHPVLSANPAMEAA